MKWLTVVLTGIAEALRAGRMPLAAALMVGVLTLPFVINDPVVIAQACALNDAIRAVTPLADLAGN